jgi:hypothetical protein
MSTAFLMADIRRLAAMVGMTDEVELDQLREGLTVALDDADWPAHGTGYDIQPVRLDHVTCWRLGTVALDCCRECVYLLRLERPTVDGSAALQVVCAGYDQTPDLDFAW